jgi:hypothetical protein
MGPSKTACRMKRDLLLDYGSTLEKLKIAEREHQEILAAGTSDGAAARSAVRINSIKALCRLARAMYTEHCRGHRC